MCHEQLDRLRLIHSIPDTVKEIKSVVHAAAFEVLEAMLNLLGRELTYFQIRGGKMGLPRLRVTNLTSRKSAQASLLRCRESLRDGNP